MVSKALVPSEVAKVPRLTLTRQELADSFGVGVGTIDKWRTQYGLPFIRRESMVLFPVSVVDAWLVENSERNTQDSTESAE